MPFGYEPAAITVWSVKTVREKKLYGENTVWETLRVWDVKTVWGTTITVWDVKTELEKKVYREENCMGNN